MKIGIMGGTFDPIHKGHLMLAECAYTSFGLDEIWFLPNGNPPHKTAGTIGTAIRQRLDMISLAIADKPYFKLERYEADHKQVSYSYETMEHFKKRYPEYTFYFIIGADSLFTIEKWVHPERLMKTCILLAACRNEFGTRQEMQTQIDYLREKYEVSIEWLKMPSVSVSSQEIRRSFHNHTGLSEEMLTDETIRYIEQHHLYEDPDNEQN